MGKAKGRGKREYGGEAQMRVIFALFPLLRKIQALSHKPLVRQTSNHHQYDQHVQKPICKDFK